MRSPKSSAARRAAANPCRWSPRPGLRAASMTAHGGCGGGLLRRRGRQRSRCSRSSPAGLFAGRKRRAGPSALHATAAVAVDHRSWLPARSLLIGHADVIDHGSPRSRGATRAALPSDAAAEIENSAQDRSLSPTRRDRHADRGAPDLREARGAARRVRRRRSSADWPQSLNPEQREEHRQPYRQCVPYVARRDGAGPGRELRFQVSVRRRAARSEGQSLLRRQHRADKNA